MKKDEKQKIRPPRLAEYFLNIFSKPGESFGSKGDFEEMFYDKIRQKGIFKARLWYWSQIFKSAPNFLETTHIGVISCSETT